MLRRNKMFSSYILWIIFIFIGLVALLNFSLQFRVTQADSADQGWFWIAIGGISSWIHILFFLCVAFLLIHHLQGFRGGLYRDIQKITSYTPAGIRFLAKAYFLFWFVASLDHLVIFGLLHFSPTGLEKFVDGTQFFRVWSSIPLQIISICGVSIFIFVFVFGYVRCAPWERKPKTGVTTTQKQQHLDKHEIKKIKTAQRLVEAGKRNRAAQIFEKLGKEHAYRAGKLYQESRRLEPAKRAFTKAGLFYRSIDRHDRAGEAFFHAEEWFEAIKEFEKVFSQSQKQPLPSKLKSAVQKYGDALFHAGWFEKAGQHYLEHGLFFQAASCFEKAGLADEAGDAYSKAGAHEESFKILTKSGITQLAGREKGRWLMTEGRFQEAASCFEAGGFFLEAGEAFEANRMILAAAQAYLKAQKFEKAAGLFIEIGEDEKAVDCYEAAGQFKKAAELAAYVGLQDRQGSLFLKAEDYPSSIRSFLMIGDMQLLKEAARKLILNKESQVKEVRIILETLIRQNRILDAMLCLEACLEGRSMDAVTFPLFRLMASMKKKLGYAGSAAEIQIKLAKLFPDDEDLVNDATLASQETGIPFEKNASIEETVEIKPVSKGYPSNKKLESNKNFEVTQTFDQDFFLDLTSEGKLGRFEMIQEIGRGGMGLVYKARDRRLDRLVAFKMLHPEFNEDPKTVLFFKREARFVAQLNHPNIVTLYDVGYQKGCFYLVMEFVDGITLSQLVNKYPGYIKSNFLALWYEAALGLQHAHESGVLHRDIKPSNIMITKDRHVKVMDFGLAKNAEDTTHSKQAWGTPIFLAPELSENMKASFQSDIYSLGAAFYLLATGQVPFKSEENHLKFEEGALPVAPDKLVNGLSPDLSRTILKCLYRNPDERYRSVKELLTALKLLGNMKIKLFP